MARVTSPAQDREEWLDARRDQEFDAPPASTDEPVHPYEEPED